MPKKPKQLGKAGKAGSKHGSKDGQSTYAMGLLAAGIAVVVGVLVFGGDDGLLTENSPVVRTAQRHMVAAQQSLGADQPTAARQSMDKAYQVAETNNFRERRPQLFAAISERSAAFRTLGIDRDQPVSTKEQQVLRECLQLLSTAASITGKMMTLSSISVRADEGFCCDLAPLNRERVLIAEHPLGAGRSGGANGGQQADARPVDQRSGAAAASGGFIHSARMAHTRARSTLHAGPSTPPRSHTNTML